MICVKKLFIALLTALLCFYAFPVAAGTVKPGTLTVSASASSVTIGSTVSVTLKYNAGKSPIGSLDARFSYNADTFEFVSGSGNDVNVNGGAGLIRISFASSLATPPTAVTIQLNLKAIAAGDGKFAVETTEFIEDTAYASLGNPSKSVSVSAINPTLSGNADLVSLKPSAGVLTPKFSPKVTAYTVSVKYGVSSLSLSAVASAKGAKIATGGSTKLKVGKNTQTVTVTAPNGTTKTYTVVINRAAAPATSDTTAGTTTATTAADKQTLEVTVDGVTMVAHNTQPAAELPEGFSWTSVVINGTAVCAAFEPTAAITLVWLENPADNAGGFYLYDADAGSFSLYRPLTVASARYLLTDLPLGLVAPAGMVIGQYAPENTAAVTAFLYSDAAMKDFVVLYAVPADGESGLFRYDVVGGTMQRFVEPTASDTPADDDPSEPDDKDPEARETNAFVQFLTDYRTVFYIGAAVCAGLGLLIIGIVLIIRSRPRTSRGRH